MKSIFQKQILMLLSFMLMWPVSSLGQSNDGNPMVSLEGIPPSDAAAALSHACAERGGRISNESTYALTCATPMSSSEATGYHSSKAISQSFGRSLARSMGSRSRYAPVERESAIPDRMVQYSWSSQGRNEVAISAIGWIEYQASSGQTVREQWGRSDSRERLRVQNQLNQIKASYEANAGHDSGQGTPAASIQKADTGQHPSGTEPPALTQKSKSSESANTTTQRGKHDFTAGKIAKSIGCEPPLLINTTASTETYQSACPGGQYKLINCEFTNCRVMQ